MTKDSINIDNLDAIISDFDGVLTDNRVSLMLMEKNLLVAIGQMVWRLMF